MRQGIGLARSGAGQDEQGTGTHAPLIRKRRTERSGATLPRIERVECVWLGFHHTVTILYVYPEVDATRVTCGASRICPLRSEEAHHTLARVSAMIVTFTLRTQDLTFMLKPQVVASNPAHHGRVIQVSTDRLRYSNGREYDIDFARHPGAAAAGGPASGQRLCCLLPYPAGA